MARYCPECGKPTIRREDGGRERDSCPACGWIQYASTAVGVGALIVRGARVLLVERGIPPVGRWTLPSGWIEQEDTLDTAVAREVWEETGLECKPVGIICVRNIPGETRNDMYVCFLCEIDPDAEPVPDGYESTQACFLHPSEFDGRDMSAFTRFVVEEYFAGRLTPWPLQANIYPGASVFAGTANGKTGAGC